MATIPRLLTYEEWLKLRPVEDGTESPDMTFYWQDSTAIVADGALRPSRFPGVNLPIEDLWPE